MEWVGQWPTRRRNLMMSTDPWGSAEVVHVVET